jgi:hypothetical protein
VGTARCKYSARLDERQRQFDKVLEDLVILTGEEYGWRGSGRVCSRGCGDEELIDVIVYV